MADEVKSEEQWVRARTILAVVIAVLVMGGAATVIYAVARSPGATKSESSASEKIRIEVRSMPAMDIAKDGRHMGRTPLSFVVSKSKNPITLQADWVEQRIYATGPRQIPRTATRTVVPDHDQTIDFTRRDE